MMYKKEYSNFVRPSINNENSNSKFCQTHLTGEEARRIYLEEVKEVKVSVPSASNDEPLHSTEKRRRKHTVNEVLLSDKDLLLTVQNNDVDILRCVLDSCPDKINTCDGYGWSLLMIACQANSIDTVKELLERGIDTSIRDKAGNTAQSLIIKNNNYALADLLLSSKQTQSESQSTTKKVKVKLKEYTCQICNNKVFPNREEHLSSTLHNINASKGRKLPTNYVIPESNRGYQMMLKVGWDRDSGLGPDGSGKKYPIKTVPKKDRKGLGLEKRKEVGKEEKVANKYEKIVRNDHHRQRRMEINFRREFY